MAGRSSALADIVVLDERLVSVEPTDFEQRRSVELRLKLRVWASAVAAG